MRNPLTSILREIARAAGQLSGPRAWARFCIDAVLYRVMRVVSLPPRVRTVTLRDGVSLTYRLNRGDILTINEVWFSEVYRPPTPGGPLRTVVDLGANVGMTSVYLGHRYGASVLAVEPMDANVALARRNLAANGVDGEVVHAAVGASDGTGHFAAHRDFNSGRVGDQGQPVTVLSMATLLARLPAGRRVDLLKVDVEGAEEALFGGDLGWLDRVDALIVEFHPDRVDASRLIARIISRGFRHVRPGSQPGAALDAFVRSGAGA